MAGPLQQFEVYPVLPIHVMGFDISITNAAIMMFLNTAIIILGLMFTTKNPTVIPGKIQAIGEIFYSAVSNMLQNSIGDKYKETYIPIVLSLFMFVLFCNIMGIIPYMFTVTSHIIVTFAMAAVIFIAITSIGFWRHGLKYFSLLMPKGTPIFMAPLIIFVEFITYMIRPISLSARLAINMTAGHIIMKIAASFVIISGFFGVIPFCCLLFLNALEIIVAILQAYIFAMLTCIYLSDAIELH